MAGAGSTCLICTGCPDRLPAGPYAYLLALHLGDGCLIAYQRDVFRLAIARADVHPVLMDLCAETVAVVMPASKVGRTPSKGCTYVGSCSKHWPCLFPQHGRGRKHSRAIELVPWQTAIVDEHPDQLLRGLLHSDGCRVINRAKGPALLPVQVHERLERHPRPLRPDVRRPRRRLEVQQHLHDLDLPAAECRPRRLLRRPEVLT